MRDLILYRPAAGEPYRLWLPIDSKRPSTPNEAELLVRPGWEAMGRTGKRIDRFFCPDSAQVDLATGIDGLAQGHGR